MALIASGCVRQAAGKATDRVARINLVDLAGSERANSTGNTGP